MAAALAFLQENDLMDQNPLEVGAGRPVELNVALMLRKELPAAALAFLQENDLMEYGQLEKKAAEATERFHTLSGQIKSAEAALQTNKELKAATVQLTFLLLLPARLRIAQQIINVRLYRRDLPHFLPGLPVLGIELQMAQKNRGSYS